jgi:hypothetical protein
MKKLPRTARCLSNLAVGLLTITLTVVPARAVAVDRTVVANSLAVAQLELRLAAATAAALYAPITLSGRATWYDARKNGAWFTERVRPGAANRNQDGGPYKFYAAAGPALRARRDFRWGKEPYEVILRNPATGKEITVTVVDWCQCYGGSTGNERLIDLAPAAFKALGVSLSRGVQRIELRFVDSGRELPDVLLPPIPGDGPFESIDSLIEVGELQ